MGLIDDKKDIFTTIGSYVSLGESADIPDTSNLYSSINNKDDSIAFILDILGVAGGTSAIKDTVGQTLTTFLNDLEPDLKSVVEKQTIDFNSGDDLPNSFKNGTRVLISDIDIYNKYKNDPDSDVGNLIYNESSSSLDRKIYDAIKNPNTDIDHSVLTLNYDDSTDELILKPKSGTENNKIGVWLKNYIYNSQFLNTTEIVTMILNGMYGSFSNREDKSIEELIRELSINKLLNKYIEGDNSPQLNDNDNNEIYQQAENFKSGLAVQDLGCGIFELNLNFNDYSETILNVSNSNDPNYVSNILEDTINKSSNNDLSVDENKEAIRDGFFKRLLDFLKLELIKILVVSPQARIILAITSSFQNEGVPKLGEPTNDLSIYKTYIKCIIKDIKAKLSEFFFNLAVGFLIKLIEPILSRFIREKINQYVGLIKSLISSRLIN